MAKQKAFVPTAAFNADSAEWLRVSGELDALKSKEIELRNRLVKAVFPGKVPEGVNTVPLPEGWVIKVSGKVNVSVDDTLVAEARAKAEALNIAVFDEIIKYKPSFSTTAYKLLTETQKKAIDYCLISKDGQPSVEITKPKRAV